MEGTVKLRQLQFEVKRDVAVECCEGNVKIAMQILIPGAFSKHRPSSVTGGIKTSALGASLDQLFLKGGIAAAKIEDDLYLEFGAVQVLMHENSIKVKGGSIDEVSVITTAFLKALMIEEEPYELRPAMQGGAEAFLKGGKMKPQHLGALCDSFYHGYSRDHDDIEVSEDLTQEEIDAMLRASRVEEYPFARGTKIGKPQMLVMSKPKKGRKKPVSLDTLMEKCVRGEYRIQFDWGQEAQKYIPSLDTLAGFVPTQTFAKLLNKILFRANRIMSRATTYGGDEVFEDDGLRVKIVGSDYINVTISGKPGTGKTRLIHALSAALGLPIYVVPLSHNTDEDALLGMTKMVDGKPASVLTDTVRCFRNGGILALEEANLPQAAVMMGALGQAIEYPFVLMQDGYIPVRRHPLCIVFSTMNVGTAGSKLMSQPFANRFKQSIAMDDPTKDEFISILQSTTGEDEELCRWVYEAYEKMINTVEADTMADVDSILLSLSMRSCIGAIESIQEGSDPREAINDSIIGKIAEQDRKLARDCVKAIKSFRNPPFDTRNGVL